MNFRKATLLLISAVCMLTSGCTTRYQMMLRDRDAQIRELNGDIARLRGENDDLSRRLVDRPQAVPASATPQAEPRSNSLLEQVQSEVGNDAQVSYRRGRLSIGVNNSVTFDSGSKALKSSANSVLRNVASVLRSQFAGHRFYVEGHTDTDPIRRTKDKYRDNRHLSMERADAVARYLIQQGVPAGSIATVGYGEHDPMAPGNKSANRRVEIVVGESM